jgi:hypothetical protein
MPVKVFCACGEDVTAEISTYDKKTRSLFWFVVNPPRCASCAARASSDGSQQCKGAAGALSGRSHRSLN